MPALDELWLVLAWGGHALKAIWSWLGHFLGWHAFSSYMHKKGTAPIFGALITATAALIIAQIYTKRFKRVDATLDFMRRFGELLKQQHDLNKEYDFFQSTIKDRIEGYAFFDRFFAEMLNEFRFFEEGLIKPDTFLEWTTWRWHDYRDDLGTTIPRTRGVSYREGWERWLKRPVLRDYKNEGFIRFLNEIHGVGSVNGTPNQKELVQIVRSRAPLSSRLLWWRWRSRTI
jgi:hypothetical protein